MRNNYFYSSGKKEVKAFLAGTVSAFMIASVMASCSKSANEHSDAVYEPVSETNSSRFQDDMSPVSYDIYDDYTECDDKKRKYSREFPGAAEFRSGDQTLLIYDKFVFNLSPLGLAENWKSILGKEFNNSSDDYSAEEISGRESTYSIYRISGVFRDKGKEKYYECYQTSNKVHAAYIAVIAPVNEKEYASYRLEQMSETVDINGMTPFEPQGGYPFRVSADFVTATVPEGVSCDYLHNDTPFSEGTYIMEDCNKLNFRIDETDYFSVHENLSLSVLKSKYSKPAARGAQSDFELYTGDGMTVIEPVTECKVSELWPDCDPDIKDADVYYYTGSRSDQDSAEHTVYYFNIGSDIIRIDYIFPADSDEYLEENKRIFDMVNNLDFTVESEAAVVE